MKKILLSGIAVIIFVLLITGVCIQYGYNTHIRKLQNHLLNHPYVAHALGGMDGKTYLNVIEAIEYHYLHGCRVFEVDLEYTSDRELVLTHGSWREIDYKRLGVEYNSQDPIPTYDTFMSWKIQNKYAAADLSDLINAMSNYKDIYVLIDLGDAGYDETLEIYTDIVDKAGNNKAILNRFIAGCKTPVMLNAIKEVYVFPLCSLYIPSEEARQGTQFESIEEYIDFCMENDVNIYSIDDKNYTESLADILSNSNLTGFVFTINDESRHIQILKYGAHGVGTDFLCSAS